MTSKEMLGHLADMMIPAKSASSALEDAYVMVVRKKMAPILEARAAEIEAAKKAEEEARAKAEAEERARAEKERVEAEKRRRDRSQTTKRVTRILLAFVLVAVFCAAVAFVAYRAEIIGGRTVPDVVGWSAQSAQTRLEECGFSVGVNEVTSTDQDPGKVVSEAPSAGARVASGSTVTIDVAASQQ